MVQSRAENMGGTRQLVRFQSMKTHLSDPAPTRGATQYVLSYPERRRTTRGSARDAKSGAG
jgi:hypothetical protein